MPRCGLVRSVPRLSGRAVRALCVIKIQKATCPIMTMDRGGSMPGKKLIRCHQSKVYRISRNGSNVEQTSPNDTNVDRISSNDIKIIKSQSMAAELIKSHQRAPGFIKSHKMSSKLMKSHQPSKSIKYFDPIYRT